MLESDGEVQAKNTQNAKQSSKIPSLNKRLKLLGISKTTHYYEPQQFRLVVMKISNY